MRKILRELFLALVVLGMLVIPFICTQMQPNVAEAQVSNLPSATAANFTRVGSHTGTVQAAVTDTLSFIPATNDGYSAGDEATMFYAPWNSIIMGYCPQPTCVCVTMDDDVTNAGGNCGSLTDPDTNDGGATGGAPCFVVDRYFDARIGSEIYDGEGSTISATSMGGFRINSCTAPAGMVGKPCGADNDCSTAGTCTTTGILGGGVYFTTQNYLAGTDGTCAFWKDK